MCIYIYIYTYICMCVCMYVCMHVCMYVYIHIYIYIYIYTHRNCALHVLCETLERRRRRSRVVEHMVFVEGLLGQRGPVLGATALSWRTRCLFVCLFVCVLLFIYVVYELCLLVVVLRTLTTMCKPSCGGQLSVALVEPEAAAATDRKRRRDGD